MALTFCGTNTETGSAKFRSMAQSRSWLTGISFGSAHMTRMTTLPPDKYGNVVGRGNILVSLLRQELASSRCWQNLRRVGQVQENSGDDPGHLHQREAEPCWMVGAATTIACDRAT